MAVRTVVAPLVSRRTFRSGVHLVLGGVILLPYVLLATGFVQLFADSEVPRVPVAVLAVVTAAIGVIPPFLPGMRSLEISAARNLLGVDLPEPQVDPPWSARWRAAVWYALHLLSGGVAVLAVLYAVPAAVGVAVDGLTGAGGALVQVAPFDRVTGPWVPVVVVALLGALGYLVAGLGVGLARAAPALLGPSPADRIALLQAQAERLAHRHRLARELHDSIGHALTVTTLQAAAAGRVLDSDPEFARRALKAVEDTGRAAMADLDHVIGLLREDDAAADGRQRSLGDLEELIGETRAAGATLTAEIKGDPGQVSLVVSRAAYRVVQEALTNALRHAGPVPLSLHLTTADGGVHIDVVNPLPAEWRPRTGSGGRGIAGMQERVEALHGSFSAGPVDAQWRVRAYLPSHPDPGGSP